MISSVLRWGALCALVALSGTASCASDGNATPASAAADSARADSVARARQDSINRTLPGYVVDSILPVEEELRRFRHALGGDSATEFVGGSATREALVRRFVAAVEKNDTADLRQMAVRGREFADLYYPESPYSHAPYKQSPALAWSLIQNPSASGLTHLVRRLGGKPMSYAAHVCAPNPAHDGRTVRHQGCLVRIVTANGDTVNKRYFGSILERNGQFKFLSYTNAF